MPDPRVFFAAERTLLAWIRTGLTIMGFGFVVARFGLFLSLLAAERAPAAAPVTSPGHFSSAMGIALVLLGALCMIVAAIEHRSFVGTLPAVDVPRTHPRVFPVIVALILGVLGILLAIYLAV